MNKNQKIISWVLRIIVAGMMIYAALPKLTGAAESIAMFSNIPGQEMARYATGVLELVGAALLLIPGMTAWGGIVVAVVMLGALGAHVLYLGFAAVAMSLASKQGRDAPFWRGTGEAVAVQAGFLLVYDLANLFRFAEHARRAKQANDPAFP